MPDVFLSIGCVYLFAIGFLIAMFWNIFTKAGYDGTRAFLLLIPLVNIIVLLMFAFGEWPARRELEMLRMQMMMRSQMPQIQQISLNAGGPQIMMPPQPQPQPMYPQPYPPAAYGQPQPQPQPFYQPPNYPQSQYPQ